MKDILIEETYDMFKISIDDEEFDFNHEDAVENLVDVFEYLGHNAEYREFY